MWILKHDFFEHTIWRVFSCTPFDPLVDTETPKTPVIVKGFEVAPPSIRLWILKQSKNQPDSFESGSCTPFDPLVDTETFFVIISKW